MAQSWITGTQSGVVTESPGTYYASLAYSNHAIRSVEAQAQVTARRSGTFSNLRVRITTHTGTPGSTIRFRKNGADGNQVISIGVAQTGEFEDATNRIMYIDTAKIWQNR